MVTAESIMLNLCAETYLIQIILTFDLFSIKLKLNLEKHIFTFFLMSGAYVFYHYSSMNCLTS